MDNNENMTTNEALTAENAQPQEESSAVSAVENTSAENSPVETLSAQTAEPDPAKTEKTLRARVRKLYNSACITLLIQYGIASTISGFIAGFYTVFVTAQLIIQNGGAVDIMTMLEIMLNPTFLLLSTAVSYLIANILSYFIGNAMTKKHHTAKIFGKIQLKPLDCLLSVLAILGVQMLSVLIQTLVMSITGMNGIDETTAGMLTISDNIFNNILLVGYTVIIAAITEELVCRGVVMRALSVKSKTFALIASSLLFGIMHGNFNQIFNGFLLGLILGYAALKSKSIFLPIILHMVANGHAMLWSFLEFRYGENILQFENIYIIVMAVVGVGAAVLLLVRNKLPKDDDGFPVTSTVEGLSELENQKGLTWKTLIKSPAFWIFVAIYGFTALISLTPIA